MCIIIVSLSHSELITAIVIFLLFIVAVVQGVEAIVFPPLRSIQSKVVDVADQGRETDSFCNAVVPQVCSDVDV